MKPCRMQRTKLPVGSRRRCVPICASKGQKLVEWLVKERELEPKPCGVDVTDEAGPKGRGLVANRNFAPGETLASMPVHVGIGTPVKTKSGRPWNLEMASQMLDERDAGRSTAKGREPWWEILPKENASPVLFEFTEEEVDELQDKDTVQEVRLMQEMFESEAAETIRDSTSTSWGFQELSWASSMMQSRSFVTEGEHWTFPLIDLCNHDFEPNAQVKSIRSPDACQGLDALEEIAAAEGIDPGPDRFALIAGEDGIRAGEEVVISYGNWPNDVFLLFFGFVPAHNPHDAVVLFNSAEELVEWVVDKRCNTKSSAQYVKQTAQALKVTLGDDLDRIVVLQDGIDVRVPAAVEEMSKLMNDKINVLALVSERCEWLLQMYRTSLEEDEDLLHTVDLSSNEQLAVRYRLNKKRLLQSAIRNLTGVI